MNTLTDEACAPMGYTEQQLPCCQVNCQHSGILSASALTAWPDISLCAALCSGNSHAARLVTLPILQHADVQSLLQTYRQVCSSCSY